MNQTHSNKVIIINNKNKNSSKFNSDAIITKINGIALGVVTADCVPIILFDSQNQIVGVMHAGWKGAYSGIIENTIKKFKKLNSKNKIYAAIGPCIGSKSYEVKSDFYKKLMSRSKKNNIYFIKKKNNQKLFNLRKYVNDKLVKLNVKVDQVNKDSFTDLQWVFSPTRIFE